MTSLLPLAPSLSAQPDSAKRRRRRNRNLSSMDQVLGDPDNSAALLDLGIVAPVDPRLLTARAAATNGKRGRRRKPGRRTSMTELMADPSNTAALADLGIPSSMVVPLPLPLPVSPVSSTKVSSNESSGGRRRMRRRDHNMSSMDQILGDPSNTAALLDLGIVAPIDPTLDLSGPPPRQNRERRKRGQ